MLAVWGPPSVSHSKLFASGVRILHRQGPGGLFVFQCFENRNNIEWLGCQAWFELRNMPKIVLYQPQALAACHIVLCGWPQCRKLSRSQRGSRRPVALTRNLTPLAVSQVAAARPCPKLREVCKLNQTDIYIHIYNYWDWKTKFLGMDLISFGSIKSQWTKCFGPKKQVPNVNSGLCKTSSLLIDTNMGWQFCNLELLKK